MRLKVTNYQNARDVDLIIDGLTVLTGISNAGKSSVLKAFYSATHNRFRGGCVTWGEDACTVIIKYDDDDRVLRVQRSATGASPRLRLGNKAKGYLEFNKLNRDVPSEVAQFNKFGYINLSSNEKLSLNFTTQFSPPFMVKFSNKRIVDILSYSKASSDVEAARLHITERNLEIKGAIKSMESVLSETKERLGDLQKQLNKYQDIDDLETLLKQYEEQAPVVDALQSLLKEIENLKTYDLQIRKAAKLVRATKITTDREDEINSLGELNKLQTTAQEQQVRSEQASEILKSVSDLQDFTLHSALKEALKEDHSPRIEAAKQILVEAEFYHPITQLFFNRLTEDIKQLIKDEESYKEAVKAQQESKCPICGNHLV